MDETGAIGLLKRGDINGLEFLVQLYQVRAVRTAYLVCRDSTMAEDIAQGAFLRVYERIGQFDDACPFHPWFFRIVVNDALKATARAGRMISTDTGVINEGDFAGSVDIQLEEHLENLETSAAIREALTHLPAPQRAAIVLRYYVGLSDDEMSDRLNCAPSTVRWRLHAARERLRRLLLPWVAPSNTGPS